MAMLAAARRRLLPSCTDARGQSRAEAVLNGGGANERRDSPAAQHFSRRKHGMLAHKQTFLGCRADACLGSFVFAVFFSKTGRATFGKSA
jgi:hypothetical protein